MEPLTPVKAIRAKCIDCCCGNTAEVRNCQINNCALHPYRFGHRPGWIPRKERLNGSSEEIIEESTEE